MNEKKMKDTIVYEYATILYAHNIYILYAIMNITSCIASFPFLHVLFMAQQNEKNVNKIDISFGNLSVKLCMAVSRYKFTYLMANSADPDQLASSEAN